MNLPIYLKNILYLIGICVIAFPFVLINYLYINALNHNSDIAISLNIFDYIFFINPIFTAFILIAPAIILDRVQKTKLLYSIGINIDIFALRDIANGVLLAATALIILFFCSNELAITFEFIKQIRIDFIIITFGIVLTEEFFFRGYIFQNIYKKNNSVLAIIISSLLFAFAHFISNDFAVIYFLNIFIAGILFCVMYIKTKSLWSSISFHFIWNILSANSIIEHHYFCGIILLFLIFIVLKLFKPSYKINSYYLVSD